MKDTITTIVIAVATFCLVAVCIFFIIEVITDTIKERKAWKRREELFKKWANIDLSKPCIYIDTDAAYYNKGGYSNHYIWCVMRKSCIYRNNILYCSYSCKEQINKCNYSTCPLLHEKNDNG